MNHDEIDYLKLKLNQLKKFNLKTSKSDLTCSLYSTASMSASYNRYDAIRQRAKFSKHLKYHRKFWLVENNPIYIGKLFLFIRFSMCHR